MYKIIENLKDSCITCCLTSSFENNKKRFDELKNMAVLKV